MRLRDRLGLQAGVGCELDEQRFVGHHIIEHRAQESRIRGRGSEIVGTQSGQAEEPAQAFGISGDKGERADREGLRGGQVSRLLRFKESRIVQFAFRQCLALILPGAPAEFTLHGNPMAKTVLIVEDNELNMKLFNDLVETQGHATVQTRSGIEAVELARKHHPDLILMDIQLPEVSGLEVTQWLKDDDELKGIPVVAVTAFAMKGDEEKIRQGGCEAYLSKPISVAKFFETMDHFLGPGQKRARADRRRTGTADGRVQTRLEPSSTVRRVALAGVTPLSMDRHCEMATRRPISPKRISAAHEYSPLGIMGLVR